MSRTCPTWDTYGVSHNYFILDSNMYSFGINSLLKKQATFHRTWKNLVFLIICTIMTMKSRLTVWIGKTAYLFYTQVKIMQSQTLYNNLSKTKWFRTNLVVSSFLLGISVSFTLILVPILDIHFKNCQTIFFFKGFSQMSWLNSYVWFSFFICIYTWNQKKSKSVDFNFILKLF